MPPSKNNSIFLLVVTAVTRDTDGISGQSPRLSPAAAARCRTARARPAAGGRPAAARPSPPSPPATRASHGGGPRYITSALAVIVTRVSSISLQMCIIYFLCLVATYLLSLGKIFRVLQLSFNISLSLALAIVFFTIKHKYFYKTRKYFPCLSVVRAVSGSASGAAVARLRCGTESHVSYGHVSRASSRRVTRRGMETSQHDTRALSCPGLVVTDKTVRSQGQVFSAGFCHET